MRKRIVLVVALSVLFVLSSVYAQTADFSELAKTGTSQGIRAAIDQRADLKARNTLGMTALMHAEFSSNPEVISTLPKAGADGKAKDDDGQTAFNQA